MFWDILQTAAKENVLEHYSFMVKRYLVNCRLIRVEYIKCFDDRWVASGIEDGKRVSPEDDKQWTHQAGTQEPKQVKGK